MWHSPHIPYSKGHPPKPTDPAKYFKNKGMDEPVSLMREAVDKGTVKIKWGGCWACPVCCAMSYQSTGVDIPSGSGQCNDMECWPAYEWAGYKKLIGVPSILYNRWIDDLGLSITNAPGYRLLVFDLVNSGVISEKELGFPLVPTPDSTYAKLPSPWTAEFIKGFLTNLAYRKGELYNQLAEGQERYLKMLSEKNPAVKPIYERVISRPGYYIHWSDDTRAGQLWALCMRPRILDRKSTRSPG